MVNQLFDQLNAVKKFKANEVSAVERKILEELSSQYKDWKDLSHVVSRLTDKPEGYYMSEYGSVEAFVRFYDLSKIEERERPFFEEYLADEHISVDWHNDVLSQSLGDDCLLIQTDSRGDNGVWLYHNLIIDESSYLDEEGHPDTKKRNALINDYMERTNFFPDVFEWSNDSLIPIRL